MKLKLDKTILNAPDNKYLRELLPRLQEKHVQNITTIALSLVTFTFFAVFAIGPTIGTIADLQKQISDDQFVNNQLGQKIATLAQLEQSYARLSPLLPAVYEAVPTTPQIAVFLGQLQSLATLSNVTINNLQTLPVDFSPISNPLHYSLYSFTVNVAGSNENASIFLKNLVSLNRTVTIDAFTLTANPRDPTQYTMNIRGSAYFQTQ